ncbi:MAG: type II toxin-antitoxin system VapC family toxin [Methanobacteriota archaeon]
MRVGDTSALYAFADEDDAHHPKAREALEDPDPIVVPTEILVETHNLLAFRSGAKSARAALEDILALPHIGPAEKVAFEGVWKVFLDSGGQLSLADSIVVQTCRLLGATPLTFDRQILRCLR